VPNSRVTTHINGIIMHFADKSRLKDYHSKCNA